MFPYDIQLWKVWKERLAITRTLGRPNCYQNNSDYPSLQWLVRCGQKRFQLFRFGWCSLTCLIQIIGLIDQPSAILDQSPYDQQSSQVIGVVIGDQEGFAQDRLAVAVRDLREEID